MGIDGDLCLANGQKMGYNRANTPGGMTMIVKTTFGTPFPTEAITAEVPVQTEVRHFEVIRTENTLRFTCPLDPDEIVYGLGETMGRVNKRGSRCISWNTDTADHSDRNPSLYSSHNLLLIDGARHFGVFFDTPARVTFEIDWQNSGKIEVLCETTDLALYQLSGDSSYDMVRQFLKAIGPSYIPPLWAFGFGQSRFAYKTPQDFRDVADAHEKHGLPLDWICMDIDYMDRFMDFSVNTKNFPDLKGFAGEMADRGIHLVPIVDAGIKVEPGHPAYDDGVKEGIFCRNGKGSFFRAGVWPGMTHFPDFLNEKARAWFGRQYAFYTEKGIEGFWNDMNEPAIFYSENTRGPKKLNMILDMVFHEQRRERKARNLERDYKSFFHEVDGKRYRHFDVHNIFGYLMTRATSEGLSKLLSHRYLLFSRSSYIGAGRYGGVWTGDNSSKWDHILLNLRHMASLNMCGFLYSGADTGGFMGDCDRELLLRWLAVSVFTPLMRNHNGSRAQGQECYAFGDTGQFRAILSLRYRLLPYLYSEYMKAALGSDMFLKPLSFGFPEDERSRQIEDQLLVGGSIMMTPIIEKGATSRTVWLPDDMTKVFYDGKTFTCTPMSRGEHTIEADLGEVVFFILKDKLVPIGKTITNTRELDLTELQLLGDGDEYALYTDDGLTREYSMKRIRVLNKS